MTRRWAAIVRRTTPAAFEFDQRKHLRCAVLAASRRCFVELAVLITLEDMSCPTVPQRGLDHAIVRQHANCTCGFAATTIDELYRDLQVAFRDGSGRQGAVRSVAPGSIATVELGALGVWVLGPKVIPCKYVQHCLNMWLVALGFHALQKTDAVQHIKC